MISQIVRHPRGAIRLAQLIIYPQIAEVSSRNRPISVQVEQDIVTVVNVAFACAGGGCALNATTEAIIFIVDR